jgi:hypothetical protein
MTPALASLALALLLLFASHADAVEIPPEGACPPYPVRPGAEGRGEEDVVPPAFSPGEQIEQDGTSRLQRYLPSEVWERREVFFFEGMRMEIGPCHRRYALSAEFDRATEENAGKARLDEAGNLLGYTGKGLPFRPQDIADDAPDAGARWAWNYRYRFVGGGFRGAFRIIHVLKRGRSLERFEGEMYFLPFGHADGDRSFAAGGRFTRPPVARGVGWRQFRLLEADRKADTSDDLFVWIPDERKVRRAPPTLVDGLYMPSYTRGTTTLAGKLALPNEPGWTTPDASIATIEYQRKGFTGLFLRPNGYRWRLVEARDVIAPHNSTRFGLPARDDRSYGPSGLSVASDRWEIRRAVVLDGRAHSSEELVPLVRLYVDAQTLQPLYWIGRRQNRGISEVAIFVGRYTGDDPLAATPAEEGSAVILPAAQSMWQAGGESWLRESYEFRTDPPTDEERVDFGSTLPLQKIGR